MRLLVRVTMLALITISVGYLWAPTACVIAEPKGGSTSSAARQFPHCQVYVVNDMIKECCTLVGDYRPGYVNCTDYSKSFDFLCEERLTRSRCRGVLFSCKNCPGHALNMIQASDGMWYLVEPQKEVIEDHPLPSPEIPKSIVDAMNPGCDCKAIVLPYAPHPNTDPFQCAGNDSSLFFDPQGAPQTGSAKERCLECCASTTLPPRHPDPKLFREMCASGCSDGLNLPPKVYCQKEYSGRACEACCSMVSPIGERSCHQGCKPGIESGVLPEGTTKRCASETTSKGECTSCCGVSASQCVFTQSLPCLGWLEDCTLECELKSLPPRQSSRSAASSSSTSKGSRK